MWKRLWNRLLIAFYLRTDWDNPVNAPPAFSALPHAYRDTLNAGCCVDCGGGSANPIHHGKRVLRQVPEITPEALATMKGAPADHPLANV